MLQLLVGFENRGQGADDHLSQTPLARRGRLDAWGNIGDLNEHLQHEPGTAPLRLTCVSGKADLNEICVRR